MKSFFTDPDQESRKSVNNAFKLICPDSNPEADTLSSGAAEMKGPEVVFINMSLSYAQLIRRMCQFPNKPVIDFGNSARQRR